jgi:hypothetical protein
MRKHKNNFSRKIFRPESFTNWLKHHGNIYLNTEASEDLKVNEVGQRKFLVSLPPSGKPSLKKQTTNKC